MPFVSHVSHFRQPDQPNTQLFRRHGVQAFHGSYHISAISYHISGHLYSPYVCHILRKIHVPLFPNAEKLFDIKRFVRRREIENKKRGYRIESNRSEIAFVGETLSFIEISPISPDHNVKLEANFEMSLGSRCSNYAINARGSKVVRNCANGGTNGETVLRDLERERERGRRRGEVCLVERSRVKGTERCTRV